jgi:hypothetical protein
VDIRRYPKAEEAAIDEQIAKLKGQDRPETKAVEEPKKAVAAHAGA